jgi:hypothetical protein
MQYVSLFYYTVLPMYCIVSFELTGQRSRSCQVIDLGHSSDWAHEAVSTHAQIMGLLGSIRSPLNASTLVCDMRQNLWQDQLPKQQSPVDLVVPRLPVWPCLTFKVDIDETHWPIKLFNYVPDMYVFTVIWSWHQLIAPKLNCLWSYNRKNTYVSIGFLKFHSLLWPKNMHCASCCVSGNIWEGDQAYLAIYSTLLY